MTCSIGRVVGAGLKESLGVRLTADPPTVQERALVVIESGAFLFDDLATNMQLGTR